MKCVIEQNAQIKDSISNIMYPEFLSYRKVVAKTCSGPNMRKRCGEREAEWTEQMLFGGGVGKQVVRRS
jgi:hypothetical protein